MCSFLTNSAVLFMEHFDFVLSLGCGIGYGYLHRIPADPDALTATPSTVVPEENPPPQQPSHGYSEVHIYLNIPASHLAYVKQRKDAEIMSSRC